MRRVFRALQRYPRVQRYLQRTYAEAIAGQPGERMPEVSVGETLALEAKASPISDRPRLNLLVPALSVRHVFGGISTALQLFEATLPGDQDVRIILTDEQHFLKGDNPAYDDWQIVSLDEPDRPGRLIVPAGNRYGRQLPVRPNDRFFATAWWTANLARHLADWQARTWELPRPLPFAYLIQDYEPGFYPWSARYALAEATYHDPERFVPVFNTSLLKRFFIAQGHPLEHGLVLEPGLNARLRQRLQQRPHPARERQILIYGRPGTERNAFPILIEGLRQWSAAHPGNGYRILSAGESHPAIALAHGQVIESLGKLSLDQYADHLLRSQIGVSLMVSPHPSYPPLEMAAFGLAVITNHYGEKDLATLASTITSIKPLSPELLAQALATRVEAIATNGMPSSGTVTDAFRCYLNGGTSITALASELRQRWLAGAD